MGRFTKPFTRQSILGFTLLEVLAALAIVSIALAALAPSIGIAVLGRLQSQRIEVATQLAQAELDRFRNIMDQGPLPLIGTPIPTPTVTPTPTGTPSPSPTPIPGAIPTPGFRAYNTPLPNLPQNGVPPTPGSGIAYANVPAPGFNNAAGTTTYTNGILGDPIVKCFPWSDPLNATCDDFATKEYVIQVFRNTGQTCCVRHNGWDGSPIDNTRVEFCQVPGVGAAVGRRQRIDDLDGDPGSSPNLLRPCAFDVTVRVYHRSAFNSNGIPNPGLGVQPARAFVTSATNQSMRESPLVVLTAQLTSASSLRQLCSLVGGSNCGERGALGDPPSPTPTP